MLKTSGMENLKSLVIFDNFEVDKRLKPKPSKVVSEDGYDEEMVYTKSGDFRLGVGSIRSIREASELYRMFDIYTFKWFVAKAVSVLAKILERLSNNKYPVEVFNLIKLSRISLDLYNQRVGILKEQLEVAKSTGQTSLKNRLESEISVATQESLLLVGGFQTYITEEQMLKFSAKCKKGLCLDWISDFVRIIPVEVYKKKVAADSLFVFDNYVVLHYDPTDTGTDKVVTEARREAVRDPILFGVILGSRKLYYIGDWVDEKCDLTLDQVIETLGEKAKDLSQKP